MLEFYWENCEGLYRLYRRVQGEQDHFLGFFNSLKEVKEEIRLHKQNQDPYVKHLQNLVDSGQFVRVQ